MALYSSIGSADGVADLYRARDEDLMRLYQSDHEAAFLVLYKRYAGKVFGYLQHKVHDQEAAADMCQIIFTKLHRSRFRYDPLQPFAPWLFTIVRHALVDWKRSQRSQKHLFQNAADLELHTLSRWLPSQPMSMEWADLGNLPAAQREALQLRYMESLSFEDIASRLETTPSNARQLVSRGIKKLRMLFSSTESADEK